MAASAIRAELSSGRNPFSVASYDAGLGTLAAMTKAVEQILHLQTMRLGTLVSASTSRDWHNGHEIEGIVHRSCRRC
jgi:hypothetical protein